MSCLTPFLKRDKLTGDYFPLDCGRCALCTRKRSQMWGFRLQQEERVSTSSWFVTLTYRTGDLEVTPSGRLTVRKSELQNFMKRLRRSHEVKVNGKWVLPPGQKTLKYYAVGEYGGKFKRPHYHLILFNALEDKVCASWDKGRVHFDPVNPASIGYVTGYVQKAFIRRLNNDDREPEFSLMSKGLGISFLSPQMINWFRASDDRFYLPYEGRKLPMPRYYRNKVWDEKEQKRITAPFRAKVSNYDVELMYEVGGDLYEYWRRKEIMKLSDFDRKIFERSNGSTAEFVRLKNEIIKASCREYDKLF